MALTKAFYEAVNSGNVRRVRIMMKDSLLVDLSFSEFTEMEKEVASMEGLYDCYDGIGFEENRDNWDDNYMNRQMVKLVSNFSHERISHVKEIVRYLRPVGRNTQQSNRERKNSSTNRTNMSYEEKKHQDQLEGRYLRTKVATGVVAGAVMGGFVGRIVATTVGVTVGGVTVVGGALVGATVGGIVLSVVVKGDIK